MKRKTTTEVVTKALARSGPEITPEQIRLSDDAQPDKNKVYTQRDYNESVNAGGGGGGGGGGVAPDLKDYAKTEYVDAGDAALDGKIAQVAKDLDVVENDYTTTAEFNVVSKKATDNKKAIAELQDAFDTAVAAAQDGAENLEIELQSYAKKEDIPDGVETPTLDEVCKKGAVTTATIGCSGLSTTGVIDAHCKWHDVPYANFQGSDAKADLTIQDRVVTVGDTTRSEAATLNVHGTVNATEFVGDGSKLTNLPTGADINLDEYARLDGATFGGQVAVRNSNNWLFIDSNRIHMTAEGMLSGKVEIDPNSLYISNDDDTSAFAVTANSQQVLAPNFSVEAKEFIGDGSKLTNLPTGGGAVGINEVLTEGNVADAAQSLKFQVSEADVPYEAPSTKDTIDLDARFASRYGATASIHQVNEPFTIDTDGWDGVYQRAKGYLAAYEVGFNGLYKTGGGKEYFVWANYGMAGAFLSITPQDGGHEDEVTLNINGGGLEFTSPDLKIRNGSVTATEFIGDGSKLTGLPTGGSAAPALPGHKWKLIPYSAAEKPHPGEMMHDDASQTYLLNAVDADGIVLGSATGVFDAYGVNGTMCVSLFKQGTGLEGFFKAAAVALKTELGETYFQIVEANHARLNLEEGQTYSVTASGLF